MAKMSYNFREALEEINTPEGLAEELLKNVIRSMKEKGINSEHIEKMYISILSDERFFSNIGSYTIQVTYNQKGGDFKLSIYDKKTSSYDEAIKIVNLIERKLEEEKFDLQDITNLAQEKDKYVVKMIRVEI